MDLFVIITCKALLFLRNEHPWGVFFCLVWCYKLQRHELWLFVRYESFSLTLSGVYLFYIQRDCKAEKQCFRGRGLKYSKFQLQPKVLSFHRACENCCITATSAESDDGEQESLFRDANGAENLFTAEQPLWWKCPCCSSKTVVGRFWH